MKKFVTMAGRVRHLFADELCRVWWEDRKSTDKERRQWATENDLSSEIGSDEECNHLANGSAHIGDQALDMVDVEEYESESGGNGLHGIDMEDFSFSPLCGGVKLTKPSFVQEPAFIEEFPGAARVVAEERPSDAVKNLYTQIWEADELYESRKIGGPYYPFSGPQEWQVVEWLHSLDVPMEKIDGFFELSYVS